MVVEFLKGHYNYKIFDIDIADPRDGFKAWTRGDELFLNPKLRLCRDEFRTGMIFFSGETQICMISDDSQSFHVFHPRFNMITRGLCMVSAIGNPIILGFVETQTTSSVKPFLATI